MRVVVLLVMVGLLFCGSRGPCIDRNTGSGTANYHEYRHMFGNAIWDTYYCVYCLDVRSVRK